MPNFLHLESFSPGEKNGLGEVEVRRQHDGGVEQGDTLVEVTGVERRFGWKNN